MTAAIRVAVAEAAGVTLRRGQSGGDASAMTSGRRRRRRRRSGSDRGDQRGHPAEDVVMTGSRDGQTPADADRFGNASSRIRARPRTRRKKSGQSGGDGWSALRICTPVGGRGRSFREDTGHGSRRAGRPRRGRPGAFPPRAAALARIIDDDGGVRWAAVKRWPSPGGPRRARALGQRRAARSRRTRHATTREESRRGVRPLRALLGKPPVASSAGITVYHSVPWGVHRERAPYEPRYVAPSLDDAMNKLVRVTDAHARRLADDRYKPLQTSKPSEAESRARELERTLRRAAADDDFFSGGGETVSAAAAARGRRSLAELDADAAAAARDLRAFDAGAGARKAARENVVHGSIQREFGRHGPVLSRSWDAPDGDAADAAVGHGRSLQRGRRVRLGVREPAADATKMRRGGDDEDEGGFEAEADLKAGNESDETTSTSIRGSRGSAPPPRGPSLDLRQRSARDATRRWMRE